MTVCVLSTCQYLSPVLSELKCRLEDFPLLLWRRCGPAEVVVAVADGRYFPLLLLRRCGLAEVDVAVDDGRLSGRLVGGSLWRRRHSFEVHICVDKAFCVDRTSCAALFWWRRRGFLQRVKAYHYANRFKCSSIDSISQQFQRQTNCSMAFGNSKSYHQLEEK